MFSNDYTKQASHTPDKQQRKCDVFQGGSDVSNLSTNQSLCVWQDKNVCSIS